MATEPVIKKWREHEGTVVASANGFDVIDCRLCGFKHIIHIPTVEELEKVYQHEYYVQDKPLYLERHQEDVDWWRLVHTRRYEILERLLPAQSRRLLEIGSGPGFFLLNGKERGWHVKGIEPSVQAFEHSRGLGLDVDNDFFSELTAPELGTFDAINMSLVLEHIPDPAELLRLVHDRLNENGLVCISVPNDFNPFQLVLRDHLGFDPWWVAPPHHINYFDFTSLANLVGRCGLEVVHQEASFPIDIFLLMGDNYIGNDEIGRKCHKKRMNFEKVMISSGSGEMLSSLYSEFARQGVGREIVMFSRKRAKA